MQSCSFVLASYARFLWEAEEEEEAEDERGKDHYESASNFFEGTSGWTPVTAAS